MRYDVFIAGFGGQGVLLAGNLLSYAALIEGKNVSFFPAYGVEKRGGAAMCTVMIADGEVGSPVTGNPSVTVVLNQASFDKHALKVKAGGTLIVNASLIDAVSLGSLAEALHDALPERNHRFIPANVKAIAAGAARISAKKA